MPRPAPPLLLLPLLLLAALLPPAHPQDAPDARPELTEAETALFDALKDEDPAAASAALAAGASINAPSPRGKQTPLMQSVLHGRTTMVEWALENGADATIGERDGYTPMQ